MKTEIGAFIFAIIAGIIYVMAVGFFVALLSQGPIESILMRPVEFADLWLLSIVGIGFFALKPSAYISTTRK